MERTRSCAVVFVMVVACVGCDKKKEEPSDGGQVMVHADSGHGTVDGAVPDATAVPVDGGDVDASRVDASIPDAAVGDGAIPDSGVPDAAREDAGVPDASVADGAVADASWEDAGVPDAAVADAAVHTLALADILGLWEKDEVGPENLIVSDTCGNFWKDEFEMARSRFSLDPDGGTLQYTNCRDLPCTEETEPPVPLRWEEGRAIAEDNSTVTISSTCSINVSKLTRITFQDAQVGGFYWLDQLDYVGNGCAQWEGPGVVNHHCEAVAQVGLHRVLTP